MTTLEELIEEGRVFQIVTKGNRTIFDPVSTKDVVFVRATPWRFVYKTEGETFRILRSQ